jgi:cell division septation protein DedD
VTESREPSYYEIALTNRQVVVAFVILLVCLLSAFFSGVWIGRESTARAQEQIASSTPPPEEKKEGQSVEELEFFDARKEKGPAARPQRDETPAIPAAAANNTTLAQDLGNEPEPSPEPPPPARAAVVPTPVPMAPTPTPTPEPGRRGKGKGRNRDRLAEAGETPAAPAGSTRPGKASQVAETAIPKGSSVIQVFSSQDRSQAEAIQKRLVKGGQKAYLSPVDVAGHTMYRVRIGPFSSRPDAQKVAEKVRKTYKLDTWVTE